MSSEITWDRILEDNKPTGLLKIPSRVIEQFSVERIELFSTIDSTIDSLVRVLHAFGDKKADGEILLKKFKQMKFQIDLMKEGDIGPNLSSAYGKSMVYFVERTARKSGIEYLFKFCIVEQDGAARREREYLQDEKALKLREERKQNPRQNYVSQTEKLFYNGEMMPWYDSVSVYGYIGLKSEYKLNAKNFEMHWSLGVNNLKCSLSDK